MEVERLRLNHFIRIPAKNWTALNPELVEGIVVNESALKKQFYVCFHMSSGHVVETEILGGWSQADQCVTDFREQAKWPFVFGSKSPIVDPEKDVRDE